MRWRVCIRGIANKLFVVFGRYFILVTKKHRIYTACGVSQTPDKIYNGKEQVFQG